MVTQANTIDLNVIAKEIGDGHPVRTAIARHLLQALLRIVDNPESSPSVVIRASTTLLSHLRPPREKHAPRIAPAPRMTADQEARIAAELLQRITDPPPPPPRDIEGEVRALLDANHDRDDDPNARAAPPEIASPNNPGTRCPSPKNRCKPRKRKR